jgi:hypothetical protein
MNDHSTHITILLDRTGSMESIRDDTIGGFNTFLDQQKDQPAAPRWCSSTRRTRTKSFIASH